VNRKAGCVTFGRGLAARKGRAIWMERPFCSGDDLLITEGLFPPTSNLFPGEVRRRPHFRRHLETDIKSSRIEV